jgi:hypothetical protein
MVLRYAYEGSTEFRPTGLSWQPRHGKGQRWSLCGLILAACLQLALSASAKPICLHPLNPHYFLFHGRATMLITSGEHYGAVLNRDFDYVKYLDTLHAGGLNLTRTFSGAYVEPSGAFNIAHNTLAPAAGSFVCPWARSLTPGYPNGGNKFDLSRWDESYFMRLKDFVAQASRRRIVVELNLLCPMYDEAQWRLSPQNAANNVNGIGAIARTNVYTLDQNGGLLTVQDALVRKIVTELKGFDNVYYEICNEPYFGGVTIEWQQHVADTIRATEKNYVGKHLISQNVANNQALVVAPADERTGGRATASAPRRPGMVDGLGARPGLRHPASPAGAAGVGPGMTRGGVRAAGGVSIYNFHYASPPDTVAMNFGLNKVIGDNETGFRGTNNAPYRREAWAFILAGGALFNNLDYSFTAGYEDGTFVYPANQPGGDNPTLRRQFGILKDFIRGFPFTRMKPDDSIFRGGLPGKATAHALAEPGKRYAIYIFGGRQSNLVLALPAGTYRADWINPLTGKIDKTETVNASAGEARLTSPEYEEDVALRMRRIYGER